MTERTYTTIRHPASGECYAVELDEAGTVLRAAGPVYQGDEGPADPLTHEPLTPDSIAAWLDNDIDGEAAETGAWIDDEITQHHATDLVSVTEIAQRAGTTAGTVHSWRRRHLDFPAPVASLAIGPVWQWPHVAAWLAQPRPSGRPRGH
jgi:hypothetical protein